MQKDLLAELHLPKLNLKSIGNIVTRNSQRLECVIKENNEFIKNSDTIPPGLKVVMGGRLLDIDVNYPLSTPVNIKTINREFIVKKPVYPKKNVSEICSNKGLEKSPPTTVKNISIAVPNSVRYSITEDNDNTKCVEIRPLFTSKGHSHSTIPPTAASLEKCPVASAETVSLMGIDASSANDEDAEVQVVLDKSAHKCSDFTPTKLNSRSLLKKDIRVDKPTVDSSAEDAVVSSTSDDIDEGGVASDLEDNSQPAMCVISEVIGNAHTAFSDADDPQENVEEALETQLITPKKTNDITKIKGWRRKQFFIEKPTTIEFYSVSKGSRMLKKKIELHHDMELSEEPGNKENAFVCDSLDEFLDQEAGLKNGYEVPHLFAELGIKLTSDEIVSRPSLSEKDLEEVETRYCVPVSLPQDSANLDNIKEEDVKRIKRPLEEDTKSCKILKVDGCRRQSVKSTQKQSEKLKTELSTDSLDSNNAAENIQKNFNPNEYRLNRVYKNSLNNMKLLSKLIALVVYPGPFRPLHPIVRYHLDKLRSYRTKVDENWANFAASAVVVKDNRCKRRIVPAYCCVRTEKKPTETNSHNVKIRRKKDNKKRIELKECRVVIKRLEPFQLSDPWCMDHNCYNCSQCGLGRAKTAVSQPQVRSVKKLSKSIKRFEVEEEVEHEDEEEEEEEEEQGETVTVSPRASFNKKIARLLAKKVRLLKANGDTLTGIDSLRVIKRDTIEFIKLRFVKESFLAGHINIWYLKPESAAVRSRAFLTFSQSPPVPNAINLSSTDLSLSNLPKVITEIVSAENTFDSNEYAILHCNSGIWEIHGSLNITFGNSDKYVQQIFTSLKLPELKGLQKVAEQILQVKAVKWWVLDLTQKFKLIEIRYGDFSTVMARKKFLEFIKLNSFGFISLRDYENRVFGAYVIQRLLPFVLIGPYYLLETRNMILKGVSSTVPFKYYGEENVTTNYPLKFFINSVIKNLEQKSNLKLEGLWLYDKMCLDKTSYIEVVTSGFENHPANKYSIVDIEHAYSLNSLTHASPSGATCGIVKRKDGKDELQTVTVYLYFDVFELGFLEGELQFDNSVIINHPVDHRTKMKSHKIGDWFISIIRRRVAFIPENLAIKWYITKHKEDLRDRHPFNKFILGGAHILTQRGVYYLLELSESKIEKLGLDKNEVVKVMSQCEVLKEVRELKNLAKLFLHESNESLSMEGVLTRAAREINVLEKEQRQLESRRTAFYTKKLKLAVAFLKLVNSFNVRNHLKIKMIGSIDHFFRKEDGQLDDDFIKKLKRSRTGWNYIKHLESGGQKMTKKLNLTHRINELFKVGKWDSSKSGVELLICSPEKLSKGISSAEKSPVKALNASTDAVATTVGHLLPGKQLRAIKPKPVSDQFTTVKNNTQPKILKTPSPVKDRQTPNVDMKNTEMIVFPKTESLMGKKDGFIKLNSSELPNNIKLCWKNWKVKKLEKLEVA